MKKLPISLIIIAHNEEANLRRCLDSVAPFVSEIIAVINDCSDNTESILTSYGAKFYEHPWEGSTIQKNRALGYATQTFVLSLDADEEVPALLAKSIRTFVESPGKFEAAYFSRRTQFLGRWIMHGDWYPDYITRLFKREKATFTGGKDHEKVEVQGTVKKLEGDLNHYGFPTLNSLIEKLPRFGEAHLKWQLERGKKWSTSGALFRAFWRAFRCYFLRRGFLDGVPGAFIALNQAYYTFYRYLKLYEYEQLNK